jgi:predicted RecA/RadA family phage recombinase
MYGSRAAVRGGHKVRVGTKFGIAAFALAVGTTVLWFYFVRQVNLPEDRTGFVVAFLVAASLGVLAYIKGTGWIGGVPPAGAILIGVFFSFTIAVSSQSVESDKAIAVGDVIPTFSALDDAGERFESKDLNGHLVLIKFFRAHW